MVLNTVMTYARKRFAAHRRYRKVMAEIRAMSNDDLHDIGAFQIDLIENARRELNAA